MLLKVKIKYYIVQKSGFLKGKDRMKIVDIRQKVFL